MNRVLAYIEDHRDEYLDRLLRFCRQPSVSATGEGIPEMVSLLEREMTSLGIQVQRVPTSGNPILYGELKGTGSRTLSFYNHYDVQPVDPIEEWNMPPFAAEIRDGKVFARGVADNKDGLASRLCAVDAYLKVYGSLPLNLKFIFEGEEEVGSPHLQEFARKYPERLATDGFAWEGGYKVLEGPPEVSLGSKGMLYVEMRVRTADRDNHSMHASILENPMWRLCKALNTLKDPQERILIDGFYDRVKPITQQDLDFFKTAVFDEADFKETMGISHFIGNCTGEELLRRLRYEPTCNICGAVSGYTGPGSMTVLPGEASAKLDLRLVPDQEPEEIFQKLRAHLDRRGFSDIELTYVSGAPPYTTSLDAPLAQTVIRCAEEIYHLPPVVYRNGAGTSPMYTFCKAQGIPAVQFGCTNNKANIHAPNENTVIEDYFSTIKLLTAVMHEFAKI